MQAVTTSARDGECSPFSPVSDKRDRAAAYLREAKRMGMKVLPPSVNQSGANFRVLSDTELLYGLLSIDGIGHAVVEPLIAGRGEPYRNLHDFFRRCPAGILDKNSMEHLIHSGALDELIHTKERPLSRQQKAEILTQERKHLSAFVSEHPCAGVWPVLERDTTCTISMLEECRQDQRVAVAGVLTGLKAKTTKKGATMYFFELEERDSGQLPRRSTSQLAPSSARSRISASARAARSSGTIGGRTAN